MGEGGQWACDSSCILKAALYTPACRRGGGCLRDSGGAAPARGPGPAGGAGRAGGRRGGAGGAGRAHPAGAGHAATRWGTQQCRGCWFHCSEGGDAAGWSMVVAPDELIIKQVVIKLQHRAKLSPTARPPGPSKAGRTWCARCPPAGPTSSAPCPRAGTRPYARSPLGGWRWWGACRPTGHSACTTTR